MGGEGGVEDEKCVGEEDGGDGVEDGGGVDGGGCACGVEDEDGGSEGVSSSGGTRMMGRNGSVWRIAIKS